MSMPTKHKYYKVKCQACEATGRDVDMKFFFFPRNGLRSQMWAQAIGKPCSAEEAKTFHGRKLALCERHFEPNQFSNAYMNALNINAVPSPVIPTLPLPVIAHSSTPSRKPPVGFTSPSPRKTPTRLTTPRTLEVQFPVRTYSRKCLSASFKSSFASTSSDMSSIPNPTEQISVTNMDCSELDVIDASSTCDDDVKVENNIKVEDSKEYVVFAPEMMEYKVSSEQVEHSENSGTDPLQADIEKNEIYIKVEKDEESTVFWDETDGENERLITGSTREETDEKTQMGKTQRNHPGQHLIVCDTCNKTFARKSDLKKHQLGHTGQCPFVCDICNKVFTRNNDLKRHQLGHSDQCPFVCDICNKAFTRNNDLKRHQLAHTGQCSFVCDICNKAFSREYNLKNHLLVHTGQRSFVCDICNKAFSREYNLKKHLLVHTGQRTFTSKYDYKIHQLLHTGLCPYVCDICNKEYTSKNDLESHQNVHTR